MKSGLIATKWRGPLAASILALVLVQGCSQPPTSAAPERAESPSKDRPNEQKPIAPPPPAETFSDAMRRINSEGQTELLTLETVMFKLSLSLNDAVRDRNESVVATGAQRLQSDLKSVTTSRETIAKKILAHPLPEGEERESLKKIRSDLVQANRELVQMGQSLLRMNNNNIKESVDSYVAHFRRFRVLKESQPGFWDTQLMPLLDHGSSPILRR